MALIRASSVLTELQETFGQPLPSVRQWIPTGSPALDKALGGGVPVGRLTEIYGPEGSGKSSLLEHLYVAMKHQLGGLVVDLDVESTRDEGKLGRLGLAPGDFLHARPAYMEQALDMMKHLLQKLGTVTFPTIIGFDSVALCTKDESEGKVEGSMAMGEHARLMAKFFRFAPRVLATSNVALVFVNQERSAMRPGRSSIETTFAGKAIPFHSSIRIKLLIVGQIRDPSGYVQGLKVLALNPKNKLSIPYRKVILPLFFDTGIDGPGSVLATLLDHGRILQNGSWQVLQTRTRRITFRVREEHRYVEWKKLVADDPSILTEALDLLWNPDAAEIVRVGVEEGADAAAD